MKNIIHINNMIGIVLLIIMLILGLFEQQEFWNNVYFILLGTSLSSAVLYIKDKLGTNYQKNS